MNVTDGIVIACWILLILLFIILSGRTAFAAASPIPISYCSYQYQVKVLLKFLTAQSLIFTSNLSVKEFIVLLLLVLALKVTLLL